MISFHAAIKRFYTRYADFDGRSQRSEYWWAILWQLILFAVILIPAYPWFFDWLNHDLNGVIGPAPDPTPMAWFGIGIAGVALLGHIIPGIAVAVRRWHDLGRSGWFYLLFIILGAIPLIGWIADITNVVWFCFPGNKGTNEFGTDPLDGGYEAIFD